MSLIHSLACEQTFPSGGLKRKILKILFSITIFSLTLFCFCFFNIAVMTFISMALFSKLWMNFTFIQSEQTEAKRLKRMRKYLLAEGKRQKSHWPTLTNTGVIHKIN